MKHDERNFEAVMDLLEQYNYEKSKLIPILQKIQEYYRYLPEPVLHYVATALKIPVAHVYGVATFYGHFALTPKGKYIVKICNGTACHVKGSLKLLEAIRKYIGLQENEKTTKDMLFTVETVSCLGACGLAPAMVVNDKVYGSLTPEMAVQAIAQIMENEKQEVVSHV